MIVVSDTSPITSLAGIGQLELLQKLHNQVVIPQAVYDEMVRAGEAIPGAVEVQTLDWIETRQVSDRTQVENLQADLDTGEAEAIVLAQELDAELLIIDERLGRTFARSYGLKLVGTLGVLLEAKHRGFIAAVKPLMDRLITEVEFRVSNQLYETVLQIANEL